MVAKELYSPGTIVNIKKISFDVNSRWHEGEKAAVISVDEADIIHVLCLRTRQIIGLMPGIDLFIKQKA